MSAREAQQFFRIRDLPYDIAIVLVKQLQPEAQVCLALTCDHFRKLVTFALSRPWEDLCLSTRKCTCQSNGWTYLLNSRACPHSEFFSLMLKLRDWMPPDQSFCYFCHKYMKHDRCPMLHVPAVATNQEAATVGKVDGTCCKKVRE